MVLKRAKCDLNGIKIAIFAAKSHKLPSSWGLCPSATRLSSNGLFNTGPKLNNFCAKKHLLLVQAPSLLAKTLVTLLVAFTPADIFSSVYTGSMRNELINAAGLRSFFKYEYKIVALKYQFLCAKVQSIL